MSAEIIKINSDADYSVLSPAANALAQGELVAFPTETVYGLGANAFMPHAVSQIFSAKGRPQDNPLIVHVSSPDEVPPLVEHVSERAKILMAALCPGPVTFILKKSNQVPDVVTAGGNTVAVRIPEHPVARALIRQSGVPVAAPSANLSGRPSPTTAMHVAADLGDKISYIVDGGNCRIGLESTVVDLSVDIPRILRPGGVTYDMLTELFGKVDGYAPQDSDTAAPKSPGMKYKHYAPKGVMTVFEGKDPFPAILTEVRAHADACVLVLTANKNNKYPCPTVNLGDTAERYANRLFDALRYADDTGAQYIFAEFPFAGGGLVTALKNRIYKSCGGRVVLC